MYFVSRRHLHTAYFTTSLQKHREVKWSRSIMHKHRRTCELCVCLTPAACPYLVLFCMLCTLCSRATRVLFTCCASETVQTSSTGLNQISREMCFELYFPRNVSVCMSLFGIVMHAVHVMFTCYARVVRQNRFKPVQTGKNPIKMCTVSSNAGYINRAATAIAITTVLLSLQSTSIQHHSHAATRRDAATVAVHQVL